MRSAWFVSQPFLTLRQLVHGIALHVVELKNRSRFFDLLLQRPGQTELWHRLRPVRLHMVGTTNKKPKHERALTVACTAYRLQIVYDLLCRLARAFFKLKSQRASMHRRGTRLLLFYQDRPSVQLGSLCWTPILTCQGAGRKKRPKNGQPITGTPTQRPTQSLCIVTMFDLLPCWFAWVVVQSAERPQCTTGKSSSLLTRSI